MQDVGAEDGRFLARRACMSVARWLIRHQPELTDLYTRLLHHCAHKMAGGGLWSSHQQWPMIFHHGLTSTPVFARPVTRWPQLEAALQLLEEPGSIELLTQEWKSGRNVVGAFDKHAQAIAVEGHWLVAEPECD